MSTRTLIFIVSGGILIGVAAFLMLYYSITQEIIEVNDLIEQGLRETREFQKQMDSFPKFDSQSFTFDTLPIDTTHAYVLKGDTSNPNIFLTPAGK